MKETILLVDDEQGIRTVMGLSLRDAGYNVITVASGEEALQLFAERPIPIVITDIRMPGMNGLDLLKHIKILAPETEVILISGHADLEMAIQGLKLEASDFITKPIDDDLLHISLKRALERIAMRNKLKEYTSNLEKMINEKSAQLVEAERQLAARQVVDGFAFGLHTLGSSMSGEQQAFNELPCFIAMHDRFMEVLAVNDLYRERLGNLVGHPSWEPYVLHSNEAMFPVERAIVEGRGARSEQILRDKNGKEIPVLVHTAPILNNEGEVELVLELSVDEQESRRLREELRVTRERFRQLFEESPCYVSVVGRDLQVLEANRAFRHTFGMQSGKRCYELFAGSSAPCDECPVQRSFQDGKPCHTEKVVIDHEGRPVNVLVWTAPLRDTSGNITECIEMATDITELRQLQDRLGNPFGNKGNDHNPHQHHCHTDIAQEPVGYSHTLPDALDGASQDKNIAVVQAAPQLQIVIFQETVPHPAQCVSIRGFQRLPILGTGAVNIFQQTGAQNIAFIHRRNDGVIALIQHENGHISLRQRILQCHLKIVRVHDILIARRIHQIIGRQQRLTLFLHVIFPK